MATPKPGGTNLRRRGAAAAAAAAAAAVAPPSSADTPKSLAAAPPPPPPPTPPPSYAEYVSQVSAEVAPLFSIYHLLVAAIASAANPALGPADVLPLKVSAVLVAAVHLAPWTASRALVFVKSLTIPASVAGLLVEALVRSDRAAAAAAAAAGTAPSPWWPPSPLAAAIAWRSPPDWGWAAAVRPAAVVGWVAVAAGAAMLFWTVVLFHTRGDGTLSPEAATAPRRLVTAGPFRVSRNPMIAGVVALVVGQAGVRCSARTAMYAVAFVALMHVQIVFVEEPALVARFGDEYTAYVRSTPRWVPGLWRQRGASSS